MKWFRFPELVIRVALGIVVYTVSNSWRCLETWVWVLLSWFSSGLSVAGRAQYLLHPELQRVRAGAGDHPQSHHRHRPRPILWEQEAVGGDVPDRVTEPPQPVP